MPKYSKTYYERPLRAIIRYKSGRVVTRLVEYGFRLKPNMESVSLYDTSTGKFMGREEN